MKKRKGRHARRCLCVLTLVAMLVALGGSSAAASAWPRADYPSRVHTRYERIPTTVSAYGRQIDDCFLIAETTYAPLRSLCESVCSAGVWFDAKTRTAYVESDGLFVSAQDGAYYIVANGRYLYVDTPVMILDDGRTYVPIRALAQALGLRVTWNAATRSVSLDGYVEPILSGEAFYDADEVYWLSRIISAESQGEPLLGQIAVGNVVLNRVRSKEFPNTIYGVIFDRKDGVQFTPVANGTVYAKPYYLSVIAAKLCLEGVTVSDRVLYFLEPSKSTSLWVIYHRPFAFVIGAHHFYR